MSTSTPPTTGSCLCKTITYTLTGTPTSQVLCHCHTCRKISSSTFTTCLIYPSSSLSFPTDPTSSSSSSLKSYAVKHESGATFTVYFCEDCGTSIYKQGDGEMEGNVILLAGTLDGEGLEGVEVGAELWVKQRVGWVGALEGVKQFQEFA